MIDKQKNCFQSDLKQNVLPTKFCALPTNGCGTHNGRAC